MDINKAIRLCEEINKDIEKDLKNSDGKEFNGKNVAIMFGYQVAAISALSDIVKDILFELKTK